MIYEYPGPSPYPLCNLWGHNSGEVDGHTGGVPGPGSRLLSVCCQAILAEDEPIARSVSHIQ